MRVSLWMVTSLSIACSIGHGGMLGAQEQPSASPPSMATLDQGIALLKAHKPRDAIAVFDALIAREPKLAEAFLQRGKAFAVMGKIERPLADVSEAIRLKPDLAEAWYERAELEELIVKRDPEIKTRGEHLQAAITDYTEAVRLKPDYADAYRGRGYSHWGRGDFLEAKADFTTAISIRPKMALAYLYRGQLESVLHDYPAALADINEALRLRPKNADWIYERGRVLREMGKTDEAIADFTEALTLNPKDQHAFNDRASLYTGQKKFDLAIADLSEAIRLQPGLPFFRRNRAKNYEATGEYEKALADLEEALRLQPTYNECYFLRGRVEARQGRKAEALRDMERAGAFYEQETAWRFELGWVFNLLDLPKRAIEEFDQILRLDPRYVVAYCERANAWAALGEFEKAMADDDAALRLEPRNVIAISNRGYALYCLGRFEEDLAEQKRALEVEPGFAPAMYKMFVAETVMGRESNAAQQLDAMVAAHGWGLSAVRHMALAAYLSVEKREGAEQPRAILEKALAGINPAEWPYPVFRYLRGDLDEDGLVKVAGEADKLAEAHGYLGLHQLALGAKEKARPHLEWVRDHGSNDSDEKMWVLSVLRDLKAK